jgi:ABC-type Fe3+-siderophore transport system permease subunit
MNILQKAFLVCMIALALLAGFFLVLGITVKAMQLSYWRLCSAFIVIAGFVCVVYSFAWLRKDKKGVVFFLIFGVSWICVGLSVYLLSISLNPNFTLIVVFCLFFISIIYFRKWLLRFLLR